MQGENLERWQTVCKEVEGEQDPHRFLELTRAILRMLTEKQHRLEQVRAKNKAERSHSVTPARDSIPNAVDTAQRSLL